MSFKGKIQTKCPFGCEAFVTEVWTFVRGDQEEDLRNQLIAGELNLLSCPFCERLYLPEATVVYCEPAEELVAFIFPEAYRREEARWREKMQSDFDAMRGALAGAMPLKAEPLLFFGQAAVGGLLQAEDDLQDEVRVAEYLVAELGLVLLPVDRSAARRRNLPKNVPFKKSAKQPTADAAVEGLKVLLKKNDRLGGYGRWLELLGTPSGRKDWLDIGPKS